MPAAVILLTLLILGGAILAGHLRLRETIRQQLADTHGKVLYALWLNQELDIALDDGVDEVTEDPADQMYTALKTSLLPQLKDVLATRLFDSEGKLIATIPNSLDPTSEIEPNVFGRLKQLRPVSRFQKSIDLGQLFPLEDEMQKMGPSPLLEISIPLHARGGKRLLGVAQYLMDGASLSREFRDLDRSLFAQGSLVFLVGGAILVIGLGATFHQLQRTNRLLTERTRNLRQANQELALAAKTSAVGAVAAHLIHGLKNPLSGLNQFIASRSSAPSDGSDTEWQVAASTARRMQSLVSDVVRVLREENSVTQYEISLKELAEVITAHMLPLARQAGVRFETKLNADGMLTNRDANLIILVLENLIQNAIQASPKDKCVRLKLEAVADKVVCEVRDEGPGLSDRARQSLFTPCQSNKDGGSGIGLAISKQLAGYIGADLDLKANQPGRCVFALTLSSGVVANRTQIP